MRHEPSCSGTLVRLLGDLLRQVFRFPLPSSGTEPATRCADRRHGVATARMRSWLARRSSTVRDLGVIRWPRRWPAVRFESASGSSPTDAGAGAGPVDPAVPWLAARSPENGSPSAASESTPHRAGHVSVSGAPRLES